MSNTTLKNILKERIMIKDTNILTYIWNLIEESLNSIKTLNDLQNILNDLLIIINDSNNHRLFLVM